jgi:hypothetical protein
MTTPVALTLVAMKRFESTLTYVGRLFTDYSSAFNIIVPTKLVTKLRTLGLNTFL